MSYFNLLLAIPEKEEEFRNGWKSLSFDYSNASPPLTPNVIDFEVVKSCGSVRDIKECQEKIFHKQLSIKCIKEATKNSFVRKRKFNTDIKSFYNKKHKANKEEVACQVHGILSLPGCKDPRYNISNNELCRRTNQPECLNKVNMISYVRLAKNSARILLQKHDVKTNQHNQCSEQTVLSKMCEEECQTLAKGISDINYNYFPAPWFAYKSIEEIVGNNSICNMQKEALVDREKDDQVTKCVLLDIYFGLEKRKSDKEINVFNLLSHSFGLPNLQNHILFLLSYLDEELRLLRAA